MADKKFPRWPMAMEALCDILSGELRAAKLPTSDAGA